MYNCVNFTVVQSKTIEASSTGKVESTNFARRSVPLSSAPSHLALNCDQSLLAVVVSKDGCATAIIYSVPSFLSQVSKTFDSNAIQLIQY